MKKLSLLLIVLVLPLMANAYRSGTCGDNLIWTYENMTLTIEGSGAMNNYDDYYHCPWWDYRFDIRWIHIGDGVTSIGDHAFYSICYMSSIELPSSLTYIGKYAFYSNKSLTSLTIPNSVTTIGESAFMDCETLATVELPSSITKLDKSVFWGCTSLTSITIPNSVTDIDNYTFHECTGLTSITLPSSLTFIGNYSFEGCTSLTSVTIPKNVKTIYFNPFADCPNLESIEVEAGNKKFDSRNGCNAIVDSYKNSIISGCKNTVIQNDVTTIGYAAFAGCTAITTLTIPSNISKILEKAFYGCSRLESVKVLANNPPLGDSYPVNDNMFSDYSIPLYVPAESIDDYKATSPWSKFTTIEAIESSGIAAQQHQNLMIYNNGSMLNIDGVNDGTLITIFSTNGTEMGSTISKCSHATINTNLPKGSTAIVRIGNKSVKVLIK